MKAILEFNLPEESDDYEFAVNGVGACSALRDTLEEIHSKMEEHTPSSIEYSIYSNIHTLIHNLLDEEGVEIL